MLIHPLHDQELSAEQIIPGTRYIATPSLGGFSDSADRRNFGIQMASITAECSGTMAAQVQDDCRKDWDLVIVSDIEKMEPQVGTLDLANTGFDPGRRGN
jgi:hypothetical protein